MGKIANIKNLFLNTEIVKYLRKLTSKFITDGCLIFSSSISFYFIFSIFPVMLIFISISGTIINTFMIKNTILDFVQERIPIIYNFTRENIEKIIEYRRGIGIAGLIFLAVATTYVFDSIQFSLNKIFKTKYHRKFWMQKIFGFLIITSIFIIILISFALSTTLFHLSSILITFFNISEDFSTLFFKILSVIIGLSFNFIIFSIIYFFGTNRLLHIKYIYKGACFAAVGWEAVKHLFLIYIDKFSNFELTYGSIGSIIAFMLWIYISSLILLLGAEINSLSIG